MLKIQKFKNKIIIVTGVIALFTFSNLFLTTVSTPLGNGKLPTNYSTLTNSADKVAPEPTLSPSKTKSVNTLNNKENLINNTSIETIDADMQQYMRNMQRNINRNWSHPTNAENKSAIVKYRILKNGSVTNCYIYKSSGDVAFDTAAINAIKQTKFMPLPEQKNGKQYVDVDFSFDYKYYKTK